MEIRISEDEITINEGPYIVAKFQDIGNGMDGEVCEGDEPLSLGGRPIRMSAPDLIALARWILRKAEDRAEDEAMK